MPSKDKPKRGNPACVPLSTCSCAKCDSPFCTNSKKDLDDVCSCDDCTESENCIFYSNRLIRVNNHLSQAEPCGVGDNKHSNFFKCLPNVRVDVSTSTFKNTIELCKSILERPRSTIESLKNLYCNKHDSSCCKDTIYQTQSITKRDKNCICIYTDTPKDKPGDPVKQKVSKNSFLPQKDPSYWEKPINYRGRETPEYAYVLRKNNERRKSLGCSEPSVLPEGLPPNISDPPGFIFDRQKLECACEDMQKESSIHDSCQCSNLSPDKKCSCDNETQKQTTVHRVSLPGFVYGKKRKEKNELPKPSDKENQTFVLQNPSEPITDHRLSIPGYIYVKADALSQIDDQDFTYVLENEHDTFAQPETPKIPQTHRVSEPGFVYAKQKQDLKADTCCRIIPEGDESEFKFVLQTPLDHPEGKHETKNYEPSKVSQTHRKSEPGFVYARQEKKLDSKSNTCCGKKSEGDKYKYVLQTPHDHPEGKQEMIKYGSTNVTQTHRVSEPGFVYGLQKVNSQDSKKYTCCGKIPEGDESEYKYVLQNAYDHPESKHETQKHTYPPKVSQAHRISEPGFVYALQKQKQDSKIDTCCGKILKGDKSEHKYVLQAPHDHPERKHDIQKQTYPSEPSKVSQAHRISEPGFVYALQKQDSKKDTCCGNILERNESDYKYVLQKAHDHPEGTHDMQKHTFPSEPSKVSQTHRISEPGFVYALQNQKQDSKKNTCCGKIPEGDEFDYKYVLQNAHDHPKGTHDMQKHTYTSEPSKVSQTHRISEPGFVYALLTQKQDSNKDTCCGKILEKNESDYKYVLQAPHDHPERKHDIQKQTYPSEPSKVSQTHRISEPGFVYALQTQKQDSNKDTCCGKIPEGDEFDYKYVLQNAHDHPKGTHDMQKHTYTSEPSKVSQTHRISEPGFVYALQTQKQDSKKDTCCGKILERNESDYKYVLQKAHDHTEGKHDMQKHTYPSEPSKVSQTHRISEPGFVYALQKQKQDSKKDTCCGKILERNESDYKYVLQNAHDHPEGKHDMQKHTYPSKAPQGSLQKEKRDLKIDTCCGKIRHETKKHPCSIPPKESLRSLSDPNIYTYVLQKPTHESKKGTCCKGLKDSSQAEPPEYLFVLQKVPRESSDMGRHKHGSCSYHEAHKTECEKHGNLNELLKHKHEGSNDKCQKVCKHKLEKKKTEIIIKGCGCSHSSKDTPESLQLSPDQKKPDEDEIDSLKLCIRAVNPPQGHKTCITCPCKSSAVEHSTSRSKSESHKLSHEIRKNNIELCKNILEIQKNAIETLNSIYLTQIKSCECNKVSDKSHTGYSCVPPKCSHESSKHSRDSSKHDFGKKPDNSCDQSHSCCESSKQSHQSSKYSQDPTKKNSNNNGNSGPSDCCEKPHSLESTKEQTQNIFDCPEDYCQPQTKHSHESMKKKLESTTTTLEYCCKLSKPSQASIEHSKESPKTNSELCKTFLQTQKNATATLDKTLLGEKPCSNEFTNIPASSQMCISEQPISITNATDTLDKTLLGEKTCCNESTNTPAASQMCISEQPISISNATDILDKTLLGEKPCCNESTNTPAVSQICISGQPISITNATDTLDKTLLGEKPCCNESTNSPAASQMCISELPISKTNATDTLDKTLLGEKPCCNESTNTPAASQICISGQHISKTNATNTLNKTLLGEKPCSNESTNTASHILEQPIPKLPQLSNFGCKECDKESSKAERQESVKNDPGECHDVHRKHANSRKSCCSDVSKKCEIPEYVFELHKYMPETSNNTQKIWINRIETIETLNNCNCNTSSKQEVHDDTQKYCECNESPKHKSAGYIYELQKNAHESSEKAQDLLQKHKNKMESLKHRNEKQSCDCSEEPEYIVELQKNTHELCKSILEQQKNTIETLKKTTKKKHCDCNPTDVSDSGYINEVQKNTQKATNTRELCKSILEKQKKTIETLKSIYLLQKQICTCNEKLKKARDPNKLQAWKKTDELCKSIEGSQQSTIEQIKSIYLPSPKKTESQSDTGKENQCCPATAMLSAEVMHLPYTDFTDPVAYKPSYLPGKTNRLSKYDIFKRIKEAYEACSCKVCECIAEKTVQNDLCKCKPCQCDDCMSYSNKIVSKRSSRLDSQIKCHCVRCNNTGKCEYTHKRPPCACIPCECEICTRSHAKSCDCEPCQCIDCKSITIHRPQTLVVAPVEENIHRAACTCSPCDCIECEHAHTLTGNVMHEMSTGTTRHAQCMCEICLNEACDQSGLDSCKCEKRNKIMNKPVEKDTHDYDIRRVSIAQQKPFKYDKAKYNRRHDTIAMFAALPKNYPYFNNDYELNNTKSCKCQECECITCVCKEDAINAIKSSQLFSSHESISDLSPCTKSKFNSPNNCKCLLCECQICDKQKTDQCESDPLKFKKGNCVCSNCDCLNCEGDQKLRCSSHELYQLHSSSEYTHCGTKVPKGLYMSEHRYRCSVCSTERCFGDIRLPNEIVHPIKRGKVLTTSTHQNKVHSLMLSKERLEDPSCSLKKSSLNNNSSNKEINVSKYNELLKNDNFKKLIQLFDSNHNTKSRNEILKYDTYLQSQERNKWKTLLKNNSVENEISRSFLSGYSSFETSPKISCHRNEDSITPTSQNKNKSRESSCNSSGHDYQNYLIRFPKSAVETCLKDVMESDVDKTLRLDQSNKMQNPANNKQCINNVEQQNGSENDLFQKQKKYLLDPSNSKSIAIKQTKPETRKTYKKTIHSQRYRDYIFELSNALHLQTKKPNVEINDHKINEKQVNDQNQIKRSENIKGIVDNNLDNSKYLQFLRNGNKVHVASKVIDYNSKGKKASYAFPIQNEEYCSWINSKQFSPSYFVGDIDILDSDKDNKRVQQTLKEAKEFSLELMKLLEMYEKANKEFEGFSGKLMMSRDSLFSNDFIKQKDTNSAEEEDILEKCKINEEHHSIIENELQQIHLEAPSIREKITSTSVITNSRKIPERTFVECPSNNSTVSQKQGHTHLCKNISYTSKVSEPIKEYEPSDKLAPVLLNQTEAHLNNSNAYDDQAIHDTTTKNTGQIQNIKFTGSSNETVTILDTSKTKKKDQKLCKQYKKYSKQMKRTIIISKRISVKNSNTNKPRAEIKYCITEGTSTPHASEKYVKSNHKKSTLPSENVSDKDTEKELVEEEKKKHELKQIINKLLDTVFGSVEEVSTSTSTNARVEEDITLCDNREHSELEFTKPWPILKKNFSWNAKLPTKNKEVCIFPSLELQIKEAVQSISLQTSSTAYPKKKSVILPHHENKALAKLQVEVKKLLDMPILQPKKCASCCDCTNEVLNVPNKSNSNLELKETPEISLKLKRDDEKNVDDEVWCSFKNEDLQAQIRDLLYITVLQPLLKNISILSEDSNLCSRWQPNFVPPKSSCDTFKVCFLGVRRISDHTMLVKWKVPQELACVRGYELLVDGRPVKKIFSPSKSLAVVTCLPHTDKVLLTVRTITSGVLLDGHYPAATMIYRPRHK